MNSKNHELMHSLGSEVMSRVGPGLLVLLLAAMSGCGSTQEGPVRAPVSGIVTLNGKPLVAGVIRFVPTVETGGPKVSVAIEDGCFELPADVGPVVGNHRIEIEPPPAGDLAIDDEQALERLRQAGRKSRVQVVRIPAVYNRNSRLVATISETQANELTFELWSTAR